MNPMYLLIRTKIKSYLGLLQLFEAKGGKRHAKLPKNSEKIKHFNQKYVNFGLS